MPAGSVGPPPEAIWANQETPPVWSTDCHPGLAKREPVPFQTQSVCAVSPCLWATLRVAARTR